MYLQCPDFQSPPISTQKSPTSRINEARNENTVNQSGMLSSIQTAGFEDGPVPVLEQNPSNCWGFANVESRANREM